MARFLLSSTKKKIALSSAKFPTTKQQLTMKPVHNECQTRKKTLTIRKTKARSSARTLQRRFVTDISMAIVLSASLNFSYSSLYLNLPKMYHRPFKGSV